MIRFLFILFLLPAGSAMAQFETLPAKPFSKRPLYRLEDPQIFKLDNRHHLQSDTAQPDDQKLSKRLRAAAWLAQARLSHTTGQGKVYLLPIDKMPCLVPDSKKVIPMPGTRPVPNSRMPNAFPGVPKGRK